MNNPKTNSMHTPELRRDFIPPTDYSPQTYKLEQERLWPKVWQIACREQEIPNAGDYVAYDIGPESFLIVRNGNGEIKAFYNVCAHRGRRLREEPCGQLNKIFCRFHGWTFDLDGKPIHIPEKADWKDCPDFADEDLSLTPVRVDTWAGFVWINMDPDCVPLRDFLSPLPERLAPFELEKCKIRTYQTIAIPVNWKIVLEAFIEGYHIHGTHVQLFKFGQITQNATEECLVDPMPVHGSHGRGVETNFGPESEFHDPRNYIREFIHDGYHSLRAIFHEQALAAADRLPTELPEGLTSDEVFVRFFGFLREEVIKTGAEWPQQLTMQDTEVQEWQVFPNSSFLPSAEGGLFYRIRPDGDKPDACFFDIWTLHRYAPGREPEIKHEFYAKPADFKGQNFTIEQDFSNFLAVHKGVRSRGWKGGRANPIQEANVYNFHRVLREYLYADPAS